MIRTIYIFLLLFVVGCSTVDKPKDELINETLKQDCVVTQASDKLTEILEFFENRGYAYSFTIEKDDLVFQSRYGVKFELFEEVRIKECTRIDYFLKKIEPINGNYYPKFGVVEFCFDSNELAEEYYLKIRQVMGKQDKKYGYLLLNEDRLIHLSTGANMYNFILLEYLPEFESILKNES